MLILLLCLGLIVGLILLVGINLKINRERDSDLARKAADKAVAETLSRLR